MRERLTRTSIRLRLWHFSDDLFVTDALPPYDDLVGARIISVNDHDVDEISRQSARSSRVTTSSNCSATVHG